MIIDGKEYDDAELIARAEAFLEMADEWWENLDDEDKITFYLEKTEKKSGEKLI
jgi:hypothetical protein